MKQNLLDMMKNTIQCEYISDLRFSIYNKQARSFLENINAYDYSLSHLANAVCYIFGVKEEFKTYEDVVLFLKNEKNKHK